MSLIPTQHDFLQDVARLIQEACMRGFIITGGELYRTEDQQRIYVDTGRSHTMNSRHLMRLAVDLNFFEPTPTGGFRIIGNKDKLQPLGDYWESLNEHNRWGGNFTTLLDTGHFERKPT